MARRKYVLYVKLKYTHFHCCGQELEGHWNECPDCEERMVTHFEKETQDQPESIGNIVSVSYRPEDSEDD